MAGRNSWAEGPWWKRAQNDPLGAVILVVAVLFGMPAFLLWHVAVPPLQRYYSDTYQTSCDVTPRGPIVLPYVQWTNGGWTLASVAQVASLPPSPAGVPRFSLSTAAVNKGAQKLQFVRISGPAVDSACVALSRQMYWNTAAGIATHLPLQVVGAMLLISVALIVTAWTQHQTGRTMRRGQTLRGPELVTRRRFNQLRRPDGVGFVTRDRLSLFELIAGRSDRRALAVRSQDESSHFLLMGDTGTGKSSLIRQLLEQVERRNEAAIVYDPALEFTPQFYRPERGDQILNPLDTRMPYWSPGDEIQHRAEALAFAKALFPEDRRDNRFFVESPRKIFARLLSFKPTAQEIAHWLQHPGEIDRLLDGTELASMINPGAPSQRAGVLASLSMIGDSFQLIPERAETTGNWSAHEWAKHRKGWIFLTSTPQTRDRLRPLITVWLDLLLTRLLSGGDPVWVFLDELPTLNQLPKLPDALALARKPNVRMVLGFQGRAQLEAKYQTESEAMLSQPATKIFLRTSEPRAAEWISKALGEIEFERLRESVNYDKYLAVLYHRKGHGYSLDRQTKPLVLASEITGLSNLTGYLKSENYVVRFQFKPNPVQNRQPALLPRPVSTKDWPQRPSSDASSSTPDDQHGQVASSSGGRGHHLGPRPSQGVPRRSRSDPAVERDPFFE
jgi:type IV secretory pathway TraG/TraD family ATPase VirD4